MTSLFCIAVVIVVIVLVNRSFDADERRWGRKK